MNILKKIQDFDLKGYLDSSGIDYKENTDNYIIKCPFCFKDKYKLYISKEKKNFTCFLCNAGEKKILIHLISKIENIPYRECALKFGFDKKEYLDLSKEVDFIDDDDYSSEKNKIIETNQIVSMPNNFRNLSKGDRGYFYAKSRGIDDNCIKKYNLKYSDGMERLIFPFTFNGNIIGWQGRDITDRHLEDKSYPKSLTGPKGFKKGLCLYNYDSVKDNEIIAIVEGPIDAIKFDKIGAVALFGKIATKRQIDLIKGLGKLKKVIIALDPEESEDINRLAKDLIPFFEVDILKFPEGTDAGDYSVDEVYNFYIKESYSYDYLDSLNVIS